MPEHENRKVRTGRPVRQLRSGLSAQTGPGGVEAKPQDHLTRQVAAWRESWSRLPEDAHLRRRFLLRVGRRLGESRDEAAELRAREVLGIPG